MYKQFDPIQSAKLIHHYLTSMVDPACDNLPYWLILPNKKPAEAAHCRVDDAELAGSWHEGLSAAMRMLDTSDGEEVLASFRRHLLRSWGPHGLRFCEKYPWTHTIHASFHEMGYILSALDSILEQDPNDAEIRARAEGLVKGMRELVIERKVRTFWSGDSVEPEPVYEFPNDVFLKDGGFDLTRHSGRGEQCIRNAVILAPLVRFYRLTKNETALDLAAGIANHLLGVSRYFNCRMEYFGHVHSALWFACGLVMLGSETGRDLYIEKGRAIYDYTRSLSSSFGWVPEYAQWHSPEEEHCETCCIHDMILLALELVRLGYGEYWEDINRFARNQLTENQIRYTGFVVCDNTLPDRDGITFCDLDRRILGGFTGGSDPNSISLERFRSVAGCCAGTAPVAFLKVWENAVTEEDGALIVNIPCDKDAPEYRLRSGIPNEGELMILAKRDGRFGFRPYAWMRDAVYRINGEEARPREKSSLPVFELKKGDVLCASFPIRTETVKETVQGRAYTVCYRACDVVDILPRGDHIRLYQRDDTIPKYYPLPEDVTYRGASNYGPTQQRTDA